MFGALQVGLGLVFWPLLFLWTTTLGLRWSPVMAQVTVISIGGAGLAVLTRNIYRYWMSNQYRLPSPSIETLLFGLIAGLTVTTRLLHIRNLVLPAWVDSVYHTMIIRVLLNQGSLPETYAPFLPAGRFFHHWGYHSLVAWLVWFLGWLEPLDITHIILHFGQLLNALTMLMIYAAGRVLFNSRWAGLLSAMLATLTSWFPAYYVNWGHYSSLTGLLVLPVLGIAFWQLHQHPSRGRWIVAVLLSAGLLTIHVRITVLALTFLAVLGGGLVIYRAWRTLLLWGTVGVAVIVIDLPWLLILINNSYLLQIFSETSTLQNSQWIDTSSIPWHLVWITHNRELFALTSGGVTGLIGWRDMTLAGKTVSGLWLLLLLIAGFRTWWQRHLDTLKHTFIPLGIIIAWVCVTALILNLKSVGLPEIRFIDNFTGVITLFLPLSLIGGGLLAWVSRQIVPQRWFTPVTALLIVAGSLWGTMTMVNIVKLTNILIQPADVRAMRWIEENISPDAHFLINTWPWIPTIYAGSDGGYWLPLLTDRTSVVPPAIIYPLATDYDTFQKTNDLLKSLSAPNALHNPDIRRQLSDEGVTHIYIGARGGPLDPVDLLTQPYAEIIYQDGSVYIFKFLPDDED
ncbi:MAG: hypothetical protein AAF485_06720 [Chloroflexota bacterium]